MEETKRCPYCGEEILAIAKKCKHCGEWLETKEPEKEKKACPVCGEQIDVDVEICPYCKEPTRFGDSEQKSKKLLQNRINKEVRDDGGIYCKKIGIVGLHSVSTLTCVQIVEITILFTLKKLRR